MADDRSKYHSERAMVELDLALKASCADAARAHFRLSSLHLEKSQALGGTADPRSAQHHL
jgi:hypothetical protein